MLSVKLIKLLFFFISLLETFLLTLITLNPSTPGVVYMCYERFNLLVQNETTVDLIVFKTIMLQRSLNVKFKVKWWNLFYAMNICRGTLYLSIIRVLIVHLHLSGRSWPFFLKIISSLQYGWKKMITDKMIYKCICYFLVENMVWSKTTNERFEHGFIHQSLISYQRYQDYNLIRVKFCNRKFINMTIQIKATVGYRCSNS